MVHITLIGKLSPKGSVVYSEIKNKLITELVPSWFNFFPLANIINHMNMIFFYFPHNGHNW